MDSELDSSDRMMISGLLYMGAGVLGVAVGAPVTVAGGLAVLAGAGLLAVGNATFGVGVATKALSASQQDAALAAMTATKDTVMKVHRPVETGLESLDREIRSRFGGRGFDSDEGPEVIDTEDPPTTEHKDGKDTLKDNLRKSLSNGLERLGDRVMKNDVDPKVRRRGDADLRDTQATDSEPGMCRETESNGRGQRSDFGERDHEPREAPMCRDSEDRRLP